MDWPIVALGAVQLILGIAGLRWKLKRISEIKAGVEQKPKLVLGIDVVSVLTPPFLLILLVVVGAYLLLGGLGVIGAGH